MTKHLDASDDLIQQAQVQPAIPLIENILFDGDIALVHGYEETFKSFFLLELAHSLSTGDPFFGELKVRQKCRVGFIETEMRQPGLGERLGRMYPNGGPQNLVFLSQSSVSDLKTMQSTEQRLKLVKEFVNQAGCDVLLWDVFADMFTGPRDPNKEGDVAFFFEQVEALPVRTQIGIRHDSKPKDGGVDGNSNNRVRGSSIWKEKPRVIFHLTAQKKWRAIRVEVGKLSYGPKPEPFQFRYDRVDHRIVMSNPVPHILRKHPQGLLRPDFLKEVAARYKVSERLAEKWLTEMKSYYSVTQSGVNKLYTINPGQFPELVWQFPPELDI